MAKRRKDKSGDWIQRAIKRPGALRAYVKKYYGKRGFTKKGTIKVEVLMELAKRPDKIGQRARLALTLRRFRKR